MVVFSFAPQEGFLDGYIFSRHRIMMNPNRVCFVDDTMTLPAVLCSSLFFFFFLFLVYCKEEDGCLVMVDRV